MRLCQISQVEGIKAANLLMGWDMKRGRSSKDSREVLISDLSSFVPEM